jgi:hypothetical protein
MQLVDFKVSKAFRAPREPDGPGFESLRVRNHFEDVRTPGGRRQGLCLSSALPGRR